MIAATDRTKGIYRRVYSADLTDKRVNALSMEAELTLHRLLMLADDFGNAQAEPELLLIQCYPRRLSEVTDERLAAWVGELKSRGFIEHYEAEGDQYLHVLNWEADQPAGKNGKRVRRFPPWPGETKLAEDEAKEGEGVPENPRESEIIQCEQPQPHTHAHTQPQGTESKRRQKGQGVQSGGGRVGSQAEKLIARISQKGELMEVLDRAGVESDEYRRAIIARRDLTPELARAVLRDVARSGAVDNVGAVVGKRLKEWSLAKLRECDAAEAQA